MRSTPSLRILSVSACNCLCPCVAFHLLLLLLLSLFCFVVVVVVWVSGEGHLKSSALTLKDRFVCCCGVGRGGGVGWKRS